MVRELSRAARGAGQIADGAARAEREVTEILDDPVGRHALDRLLITPNTLHEHPELNRSFSAYISPDGRFARFDVIQAERMNSEAAMDQVVNLRRRLDEYLGESRWLHVGAGMTGANAESADIRALCCWALDLVGIPWRQSNHKTISVSRREAVTALDDLIGFKS